jgi:hypothetical protein
VTVYSVGIWTVRPGREDECFGPWSSFEQVEARRAAPEWQAAVGRMREALEDVQTGTCDVAAESGA